MNLYPNDLGEQVNQQLQQERGYIQSASEPSASPARFLMGMFACVPITIISFVFGCFWVFIPFGMITLILGGCYTLGAMRTPKDAKGLEKPISDYEVQMARAKSKDALIQDYLDLALSVVKLPATKDEAADREVRDAITALGSALEALPPEQAIVTDDPAALRTEAQAQMENAQGETDSVIAASQRRRAESLLRRADTAAKTLLLLRRNRALRDEVGEQIQALRTSLTALQIGGRQSAPELSGLAASIHRVALEANAVTVARAEVDTLLSQPVRSVEETEPQAMRLRI